MPFALYFPVRHFLVSFQVIYPINTMPHEIYYIIPCSLILCFTRFMFPSITGPAWCLIVYAPPLWMLLYYISLLSVPSAAPLYHDLAVRSLRYVSFPWHVLLTRVGPFMLPNWFLLTVAVGLLELNWFDFLPWLFPLVPLWSCVPHFLTLPSFINPGPPCYLILTCILIMYWDVAFVLIHARVCLVCLSNLG